MSVTLSNRVELLKAWNAQNIATKAAIATEREMRVAVIEAFSDDDSFPPLTASGTENVDIGEGFDLKILHKLDYKLDTGKANDCIKLDAALSRIEDSMEGGKIIADRLVKWKPELSVSEYKLLAPAQKKIIDDVLTIKPASKSIEIAKRGG